MRHLLILLLIFSSLSCLANLRDSIPNGLPQQKFAGWVQARQFVSDSGAIYLLNDTVAKVKFGYGAIRFLTDNNPYYWGGTSWKAFAAPLGDFVKYTDSTIKYVTPTQLNDSVHWVLTGNNLYPKSTSYKVGVGAIPQFQFDVQNTTTGRFAFDGSRQVIYNNSSFKNILIGELTGSNLDGVYRDNYFIGLTAGRFVLGDRNIVIGTNALEKAVGNDNLAIGYKSLSVSDSNDNVAAGFYSGVGNYGKENTAIGSLSGNYSAIGSAKISNTEIQVGTSAFSGSNTASFITAQSLTIGVKYSFLMTFNGTAPQPYLSALVNDLYVVGVVTNSNTITLSQASTFSTQGTDSTTLTYNNSQNNAIAIGYNVMTDSTNQIKIGNSNNSILKSNKFVVDIATTPVLNWYLRWDGTKYIPAPQTGGGGVGGDADSLVSIPGGQYIHVASPSTGDMLYYNGSWQKLAIGTTKQTLHVVGGLPVWVDTSASVSASPYSTLTYSSTPTLDYNVGQKRVITLTGNATVSYSNFPNGGELILYVIQDGSGGHTLTFPSGTIAPTGVLSTLTANLSTAAGAQDKISITYNNITNKYEVELAKAYQ